MQSLILTAVEAVLKSFVISTPTQVGRVKATLVAKVTLPNKNVLNLWASSELSI